MTRYASKPSFDKWRREKRKKKRNQKSKEGSSQSVESDRSRQRVPWKPGGKER